MQMVDSKFPSGISALKFLNSVPCTVVAAASFGRNINVWINLWLKTRGAELDNTREMQQTLSNG